MIKKILFSFLFLITFISSSFATHDTTTISKAQQTYYEEGREWEYLEQILISKIDEIVSKTNTSVTRVAMGTFILLEILLNYSIFNSNNREKPIDLFFIETSFLLISGGTALLAKFIGNSIYNNKIQTERITSTLKMFFKQYNPEIKPENNKINYKKFIPQELHKTFDSLYQNYIQYGESYLEKNSSDIISSIQDKIVYEIKNEKYGTLKELEISRQKSIRTLFIFSAISTIGKQLIEKYA